MELAKVTPLNPIPVYGVEKKEKKQTVAKLKPEKKAKPKTKTTKASKTADDTDLNFRVAMCAYYKAEARGFAPGFEMQDWLAAEAEMKNEGR
ncbi:MAG TPA: DUF2934 domain-containing protein [Methylotenera sp.]|nr:DUF2934 domain-containing protein [Methylotenera sp.]HPH05373.1 DUF2934 domain-containing protein [Methylotenera sp.]HPN01299.1 DUF2934 domain-containing protein [Methylotenera sp.]